jgi:hypothetical protein
MPRGDCGVFDKVEKSDNGVYVAFPEACKLVCKLRVVRPSDPRRNLVLQRNELVDTENSARSEISVGLLILEEIQISVVARVERVSASRWHGRMTVCQSHHVPAIDGSLARSMGRELVRAVILRSSRKHTDEKKSNWPQP